jgi:hypothetical protein
MIVQVYGDNVIKKKQFAVGETQTQERQNQQGIVILINTDYCTY